LKAQRIIPASRYLKLIVEVFRQIGTERPRR
jgi:hypothetical protein